MCVGVRARDAQLVALGAVLASVVGKVDSPLAPCGLHCSKARLGLASFLRLAMSDEVLLHLAGILQCRRQLVQSIAQQQQQQEYTHTQQHQTALLTQFMQAMNERGTSDGFGDEIIFLNKKSAAKPVMWAG